MKETFWAYLFIVLGLLTITVMILIQNLTTTSEENYYLTKEVMEAAMIDSIDYGVYAKSGEIRIIESKFVENFTRRFAESINDSKDYTLEFYEIYESPPKATVVVKTETGNQTVTTDSTVNFDIRTIMSGILETKYSESDSVIAVDMSSDKGTVLGKTKYTSYDGRAVFEIEAPVPYIVDDATVSCSDANVTYETNGNMVIVKGITKRTSCKTSLKEGKSVTLTMNSSTGQVSGDKIKATKKGGSVSFEVVAKDGYTLENPTIVCDGGATGTRSGNNIVINNVQDNQKCDVTFKRGKYKVTFNVLNGGTTISNPVQIEYGETAQVPIYANLGYTTKDMVVSCSKGASANISDNMIEVSNVTSSQTCTVSVPEITAENYPYFVAKNNGIYDVTIVNKKTGQDNGMKTTYSYNGYNTIYKVNNGKEKTFSSSVNGGTENNNGVTISILATNVGDSLVVNYILENTSSSDKTYSVASTADIYLIGNDHIKIYKESNSRLYTAKYNNYSVEYLFEPSATSTWIGFYKNRSSNKYNNSSNGSNTGSVDSGLAFSWSGTIAAGERLVKTVKFVVHY